MESQLELNDERLRLLGKFKEAMPEVSSKEVDFIQTVYRDGALSIKMKRLMSLAIALRAGCVNCTLAQTIYAVEAGATKEEIMETLAVEIAMSGTTGIAESLRVVKLLDELGKL